MNFLQRINVGSRLMTAFMILCAICAAVGGVGIFNMSRIHDNAAGMYTLELLGVRFEG